MRVQLGDEKRRSADQHRRRRLGEEPEREHSPGLCAERLAGHRCFRFWVGIPYWYTTARREAGNRRGADPSLYGRIRAAILSLELAPGQRLSERGLEPAFGASRTPIPAALMRLEPEGL